METEHNWTLFKEGAPAPVISIPKHGRVIAVDMMMKTLDRLKIDDKTFFDLLAASSN